MTSVRRRGEHIRVTIDRDEVVLLASLVGQVATMLEVPEPQADPETATFEEIVAGFDAQPEVLDDPILQRLLPDGYRDDAEAAQEFRRLTDSELRATKGRALHRVIEDLALADAQEGGKKVRVDLDEEAAESWLHAINDVRLALGTRLDIREETDVRRRAETGDEQEQASYAIYDWLTWMQESIVRQLIGD